MKTVLLALCVEVTPSRKITTMKNSFQALEWKSTAPDVLSGYENFLKFFIEHVS